jgi:hypothetical protein
MMRHRARAEDAVVFPRWTSNPPTSPWLLLPMTSL